MGKDILYIGVIYLENLPGNIDIDLKADLEFWNNFTFCYRFSPEVCYLKKIRFQRDIQFKKIVCMLGFLSETGIFKLKNVKIFEIIIIRQNYHLDSLNSEFLVWFAFYTVNRDCLKKSLDFKGDEKCLYNFRLCSYFSYELSIYLHDST